MRRPRIAIVTPYGAASNTGNWHTAARIARILAARYRVRVIERWDGEPDDALIALHARRSADSIRRFAAAHPDRPLIVMLTGTDVYRDIASDRDAQRSLRLATRLVALNESAPMRLPAAASRKCAVIEQSARTLAPARKPARTFRIAVVGHLREEKNPQLVWRLLRRLRDPRLRVEHIGAARDARLARRAREAAARDPRYRWLGGFPRAQVRQRIRHAHVLLHPSHMEGGAAAIVEAATAHTAVVASRIDGHVGLLGRDHPGLFDADDADDAARLLARLSAEPRALARVLRSGERRAVRFGPGRERRAWLRLLGSLL